MTAEQFTEMRTIISNVLDPEEASQAIQLQVHEIAADLAAAGFVKDGQHRTITTPEELRALPLISVVLDKYGCVFHLWPSIGWAKAGPTLGIEYPALPVVVLLEPKAKVPA